MQIDSHHSLHLGFTDKTEINALKNILSLAIKTLQRSPVQNMHGNPMQSQAGIKGGDLIETKEMIERLASHLDMGAVRLEPEKTTKNFDLSDAFTIALLDSLFSNALPKTKPGSGSGLSATLLGDMLGMDPSRTRIYPMPKFRKTPGAN